MKKNCYVFWYVILFLFVLLFDRVTKFFALVNQFSNYKITDFLEFDLVYNRGMSWGMLDSKSTLIFVLVSAFICLVTLAMATYAYLRFKAGHNIFGEIIVIAGSLSNIIDRVIYGGVIDFIVFSCDYFTKLGKLSFPIFNLADTFIFIGVFIITINIWRNN
ncbi:MAG: lipoprotein signal peptidase [uncultured bacterium]|jgi:signal peptidase II|nr:MAG: lipoprotein signal peptidase [uncultured bacterium]KKP28218.1 MAG: Lipoprotein signal peptidase [candidate division TM6 bacterium GW2011_GWF2_30_66]